MGNLIKAKALVLQGIRRAPHHAALWTVAGLVEDRLGDHARAKKFFETGIERFPDHGALYKVLGEQYEKAGSFLEARKVFALGLERDPHCAPVYHAAALLEARLGNLDGLSEMHKKARGNLGAVAFPSSSSEADAYDIIERIKSLEESVISSDNDKLQTSLDPFSHINFL